MELSQLALFSLVLIRLPMLLNIYRSNLSLEFAMQNRGKEGPNLQFG
jgi:hypothetical protein